MTTVEAVKAVLGEVLGLGARTATFAPATPLLGNVPELDSMAVLQLIVALEKRFDITIHDDEISAEAFATVGTLAQFVQHKLSAPAAAQSG